MRWEGISDGEDSEIMMFRFASFCGHFIPALLLTESSVFVLLEVLVDFELLSDRRCCCC